MRVNSILVLMLSLICGFARAEESPDPGAELDVVLSKAIDAERRDDFKSALEVYSQAVKSFPAYSRAWAAYGEHLRFYAHDFKQAEAAFRRAILEGHDSRATAFAWRGLGELEAKEGHDARAVEMFERSLKEMPLVDTYRSLCHLMVMQHDWAAAARYSKLAADLEPSDPIALLLLASQLHRAGKIEEGRTDFKKALSMAGVDENGHATGPVHCCVLYNAAGYLGVVGEKNESLNMLESFFKTPNHLHLSREQIADDPDFTLVKSEPRFTTMLKEYTVPQTQKK